MTQDAVYMLRQILDDRRYEGFAFKNRKSSQRGKITLSQDFLPDDIRTNGRNWHAPRMEATWIPQPVIGKVKAFNDFPCVDLEVPAFSQKAVDALSDFLNPNGELLPLVSSVGKYYAYNATTVSDALDLDQSIIEWFDDDCKDIALHIKRYEFNPAKLKGLTVFKIVEEPGTVYVTQPFMDRIAEAGLKGFKCPKLWPP